MKCTRVLRRAASGAFSLDRFERYCKLISAGIICGRSGHGAGRDTTCHLSRDLRFGAIRVSTPCAGEGATACRSPLRGFPSGDTARS
jgi:hypothetical protein